MPEKSAVVGPASRPAAAFLPGTMGTSQAGATRCPPIEPSLHHHDIVPAESATPPPPSPPHLPPHLCLASAMALPSGHASSPAAYVLTYILSPHDQRLLRQRLARLHLARPSPPPSPQYPATTPASSVPTTPTSLVHHVDLNASLLDDQYLPLTSRKAIRAALLVAAAQAAFDALLFIRAQKTFRGSSRALTRRVAKSGLGAGFFVVIYRTLLQIFVMGRVRVLLPKVVEWRKEHLPEPAPVTTRPRSRRSSSVHRNSSSTRPPSPVRQVEVSHRERFLRRVLQGLESPALAPALAGFLSAPALALLPQGIREYYALDAFVKAVKFLVDDARATGTGPLAKIPRWVGASLVFALANGELVWATLFERDTVNRIYGNLLLSRSSAYIQPRPEHLPASIPWPSQQEIIDTIAQLSTPKQKVAAYPAFKSPLLSALSAHNPSSAYEVINPILDYAPAHPDHTSLLCAVLHPNNPSCRSVFFEFWRKQWPANLKLVSLVLGAVALARFKTTSSDPETAVFQFGMGSVQAATFLTGFVGSMWATHCFLQEWIPRTLVPKARYFLNGAIASLFMFALPTAWRGVLASYAARYSLFSTFQTLKKRRLIRPVKNGDIVMLACALAALAPLYEEAPKVLDRNYQRIFGLLIGPRQGGAGASAENQPTGPLEKEGKDYFLAKAHLRSLSTIHPDSKKDL